MKGDYEKLMNLIIEEMRKKSLTMKQVSRLTGVSIPTVSNLINGKTKNPNASTMMKLANGLGIPKAEIRKAVECNGTE